MYWGIVLVDLIFNGLSYFIIYNINSKIIVIFVIVLCLYLVKIINVICLLIYIKILSWFYVNFIILFKKKKDIL